MREELLNFLTQRGTLPEPKAIDYLLSFENPLDYLSSLLNHFEEKPLILTLEEIRRVEAIAERASIEAKGRAQLKPEAVQSKLLEIQKEAPAVPEHFIKEPKEVVRLRRRKEIVAREYGPELKILKDITGKSTSRGKMEDFQRYFRNRFQTMQRMLLSRRELGGCVEVSKAKKLSREVCFICIVNSVKSTKSGHKILEVEDETGTASVLITKTSPLINDWIVPDEVVGIRGSPGKDDLIIAESIVHPEVPINKEFRKAEVSVSAAFISDVHVGSKSFLEKKWSAFSQWINDGEDLAKEIKYLVISGDVVDGIGVYPRQDEDLLIDDIHRQYEEFAKLLSSIPEWIKIIVLPGNHDAVRPAEPQPAIPTSLRNLFSSDVIFVGNPCYFQLHGVEILSYHGKSIDDFVSTVPSMTYSRPLEAMKEMLRKRHLAPTYGGKTPIAPEEEDYLIIEKVPDIFVTGHVHGFGMENYRGIRLINSSAWQSQTSYQKMRNIDPVPGKVPIVNLASGEFFLKEF